MVILRGSSVNREADDQDRERTIINSVFVKVRVESGVVVFIPSRIGRFLGKITVRVLESNQRHR